MVAAVGGFGGGWADGQDGAKSAAWKRPKRSPGVAMGVFVGADCAS